MRKAALRRLQGAPSSRRTPDLLGPRCWVVLSVLVVVALLEVPLPSGLLGTLLATGLVGGQREQRNLWRSFTNPP